LKKGNGRKYRGNLPLNCFNCDGIDHFGKKCPDKKNKMNDEDDSNRKQMYKGKKTKNKFFKNLFFTK
jgi:hypothetical protein